MPCKICERKAEKELCGLHEEARSTLFRKYEVWRKSLNLSWTEYLQEIRKNAYAGLWVKEVASYLLASNRMSEQDVPRSSGVAMDKV